MIKHHRVFTIYTDSTAATNNFYEHECTLCVHTTTAQHHNKPLIHVLYTLQSFFIAPTVFYILYTDLTSQSQKTTCRSLFYLSCGCKQSVHAVQRQCKVMLLLPDIQANKQSD